MQSIKRYPFSYMINVFKYSQGATLLGNRTNSYIKNPYCITNTGVSIDAIAPKPSEGHGEGRIYYTTKSSLITCSDHIFWVKNIDMTYMEQYILEDPSEISYIIGHSAFGISDLKGAAEPVTDFDSMGYRVLLDKNYSNGEFRFWKDISEHSYLIQTDTRCFRIGLNLNNHQLFK